ncbi:MAG: TolC family outer membrane protein [Candidatus Methylumidiphilus sp.]
MKRIGCGLLFCLACSISAWPSPAQAEDLLQVYELALRRDPKILEVEASRDAALEVKPQSVARLLPTLAIVGNLNQSRFDTTNTFTNQQVGIQHFWDSTLYLKLSQPIYHHDYWVGLSQADNLVAQAEAEYGAEQQSLFIRTAKAYFAVLSAQDNLEFANAEKTALERQMQQADRKFEVGEMAVTDLREAQAGYDLSVASAIAAQRAVYVAKVALREIIGVSDIDLSRLGADMPLPEPAPSSLEAWSELSQRNNLTVIAAENRAESARKNVELQFAGHYPTLDLVGSVGIADSDRPAGLVANSQSVGVQMNIPLFQGGAVSSKVRQAGHQYDAALHEVDKNRREVEKQVQDAFYGVMFSIRQVKALHTAVESTGTAVEAAEAGLRVGTRTMVDVLATQRAHYRARRDYAQARYDFINNSLLLKQSASLLSRQDIELANGWLDKAAKTPRLPNGAAAQPTDL